jgi:hypothetical protein
MHSRGLIAAASAGIRTGAVRGGARPLVGSLDDFVRYHVRCQVGARGGQ